MDYQVKTYCHTADNNVHAYRIDNEYFTSVQPSALVGRTATTLSKAQHGDNLLVLVW